MLVVIVKFISVLGNTLILDGAMAETGSHEKLLAEKGLYYAMWRQQVGERKKITAPLVDEKLN